MATVRPLLDQRREKSNGTFPVKIRIGYGRKAILLNTVYSLTLTDFNKVLLGKNLNENQKSIKAKLDVLQKKATDILDDMDPFCPESFVTRFSKKGNKSDLLFLLTDKATRLYVDDKHGNANLYSQAAALLSRYNSTISKATELPISSVNTKWLKDFESWALKLKRTTLKKEVIQEYGKTTLGMYLIRVRSIFNDAITNNELSRSAYPFHKADNQNGYKIPKGVNNKRALSIAEIMQVYNYNPEGSSEQFAKDIFIFSYLSSGMNCIDIFRLKWSDIKGDHFSFVRKKTENKEGGTNKITIGLNEDLLQIIERHGTHKIGNNYIFNVIPGGCTEKELLQKVRTAIALVNVYLKKIASKLDITIEISTYYARHSFATNLMNSEVPLAFISKQLGHTDIKTTQNYLDGFTDNKAAVYQANLLDKKIG